MMLSSRSMPVSTESTWMGRRLRALKTAAAIAILGIGPLLVGGTVLWLEAHRDLVAEDFRLQVLPAAHAVLHGASPYPRAHELLATGAAYVYPASAAVVSIPFAALPDGVAAWVLTGLLVALVPFTLYALQIEDWRCYGAALLWAPVASSIQTGNLTLPIALCGALAWRYRDRRAGIAVGVATALKLFTWPLSIWLAATGRRLQSAVSVLCAVLVILVAWSVIGFTGITDYPALARRLNELQAPHSYTLYAFGLELGAPDLLAKLVWLAAGLAALGACIVLGRRGDDRRSFALAVVASLALSPIVWLHYFELLLVPLAVTRPRFGLAWLLPLALWVVPADGNGRAAWQTALALGVFGALSLLCLAPKRTTRLPERAAYAGRPA
jgi:hypothetical protein